MADPSYNYSYTPTVDHREANLYREEYYSSTDTKIYMDNIEQTEIAFIQYEIQEQLKPVYGYNSRTFDDVVIGNRIVTGTFSVPIKNKEQQLVATYADDKIMAEVNSITNFNEKEENSLYDTEWFGSTIKNIDVTSNAVNEKDREYLVKLIALGYNINNFSSPYDIRKAIKQFQNKELGSASGLLNDITKEKINEEFSKLSATELDLEDKLGYSNTLLNKNETILHGTGLIIDTFNINNKRIFYVLDSNGKKFYIDGESNE